MENFFKLCKSQSDADANGMVEVKFGMLMQRATGLKLQRCLMIIYLFLKGGF